MPRLFTVSLLSLALISAASCSGSADTSKESAAAIPQAAEAEELVAVDTMVLRAAPFARTIVSNGKLKASKMADVYFGSPGTVAAVNVRNGSRVQAGQPLAALDSYKLDAERRRQEAVLEQARLEMADVLIGQGYDPARLADVPEAVLELARVRSGLRQAEASADLIERQIAEATVRAPFAGVVANVKAVAGSTANTAEPFCRVIADRELDIEFSVLETELPRIAIGDAVTVIPVSGQEACSGRITEINPLVEDNGNVKVKATVGNGRGLLDGMSARVTIAPAPVKALSVPKQAVAVRSGRTVVFTWNNGHAEWHDVTLGQENDLSHEITSGLAEGDIVIVGGAANLAHLSPVTINNNK